MKIMHRFIVLTVILIGGFVVYGGWSFKTLNDLKVNGPLYQHIIQGKDLIADILPPPEYIIESYLVALQAMNAAPAERGTLIERLKVLKNDYDTRHLFWEGEDLDTALKEQFLNRAHAPAQEFYRIAFEQFVPALVKDDMVAAGTALDAMKQRYETHRAAIDKVVEMTVKRNEDGEARAKIKIRTSMLVMLMILAIVIGLTILSVVIITRSFRPLTLLARQVETVAQGDLSINVKQQSQDEIGMLFGAFGKMVENLRVLVGQITGATAQLASAAEEMSTVTEETSQGIRQQQSETEQVATAMNEMSATV
ncbi:MAG: methyl-accepting chemotaxis protein, partial [Pseudomonadota bacterium]